MAISELQKQEETERRDRLFKEYLLSEEYQKKLKQRLELNDAGNRLTKARSYIWHLCERPDNAKEGIKFFVNNFCYTFSPKTDPKHLPFITFDFQDRAIEWIVDCIEGKKDGLLEKSREMGMTWLIFVVIPVWYWLFRDGINILVGSYKEMLVDDKTLDSIFGKIDYTLQGLPKWMLPKHYNPKKHRTKLKLINPATSNLISGDTMNPNFGRGSRKTMILFDELGFWDYAKDAWDGSDDSTNCRIANSTPHGYNYYAQLRENEDMNVLSLLWKLHPLKDQQWYDFECARRPAEVVAQELDISYSKSREGKVYPEWNDINVSKGVYGYRDDLPLYIGWDFGKCLTGDTEALTQQGWKTHDKLEEGDLIYTLNPETGVGEWQPMKGKLVMRTDEIISVASGKGFKSRFTSGHSFPVKRNGIYELDVFDNINSCESIPSGAELKTLPKNKKYSDSFVELVAWFWTEGYINDGGVEISQAKSENFKRIRNCLHGVYGDNFIERKPKLRKNTNLPLIRWYIYKKHAKNLLDICDSNKVVKYEFINSLTKKQLELFIEASLLADGYNGILKQAVKERTERFAYAALLLGKKLSYSYEQMGIYGKYRRVDIFTTKPKVVPYNFRRRGKVKQKRYKGVVWCPTVSNHIWLARSNGSVYFTGNTDDCAIIWSQRDFRTGKLRIIDTYRNTGKNIDYYIPFITGMLPSGGYKYTKDELEIIGEHKGWKKGTHFGDPAGRFVNAVSDETVISVLKDHGIIVNFQDKWKVFSSRKSATKRIIMDGIDLNNNPRTNWFNICMINSSYPKVKQEGLDVIRSEKPKHDDYSHFRSSFEYLALGLEDYKPQSMRPKDMFPKKENKIINRKNKIIGY